MNLAQLRHAVDIRTGIAVDPVALTEVVNEAAQAVAAEADWPWLHTTELFATAVGQGSYPTPADWGRTRSLAVNGRTLPHANIRDLEDDGVARSGEYVWTIEGDLLLLRPTPTRVASVTHRYVATEPALVGDDDAPRLPAQFHPAVVAYAAYLVFVRADDRRHELAAGDYQRWLKRMADDMRRKTGPFRIRVRPGYEGP